MAELITASLENLLQLGVPLSVAEDLIKEISDGGPFVLWDDFLQRLFYGKHGPAGDRGRRGYSIVPQDHRLLQEVGLVISTDLLTPAVKGPWWTRALQRLSPPGAPPDDAFPAEFRGPLLGHGASLLTRLSSGAAASDTPPEALSRDRELHFQYMFAQVQYVDSNTYSYLGYSLSRAQKERLVARWASDYPELSEGTLSAWDAPHCQAQPVSTAGQAVAVPFYEMQSRKFRSECWDALLRGGMRVASAGENAGQEAQALVPALPDWLGAASPGQVAGSHIPFELRQQYRVDPYGNVVALEAEPNSICAWDVDHVFPRKRGGRSVLQNFAATHWYADRHIKTEKLLCSILLAKDGRNPLTCGLTEAGLAAMWEGRSLLPPALQPTSAFTQLLTTLLCSNWRRSEYKDLFNTRAGLLHVTPTSQLFEVLLQEFQAGVTSLVAGWHVGLLASSTLNSVQEGELEQAQDVSALDVATQRPTQGPSQGSTASQRRPAADAAARHRRSSSGAPLDLSTQSSGVPGQRDLGAGVSPPARERRSSAELSSEGNVRQRQGQSNRMQTGPAPRTRMGSAAISSQAALQLYNQMVALGQEACIPQLSSLPVLPDSMAAEVQARVSEADQGMPTPIVMIAEAPLSAHQAGGDSALVHASGKSDSKHRKHTASHTDASSVHGDDQTHKAALRKAQTGVASAGDAHPQLHDPDAQRKLSGVASHHVPRPTSATGGGDPGYRAAALMMGEEFFSKFMTPTPVKRARPRMTSAHTQTASAEERTSTGKDVQSPVQEATPRSEDCSHPGRPSHTTPRHPYVHAGITVWNAIALPPAMPPSTITMEDALASTHLKRHEVITPTYRPLYDPLTGKWPPRPRNPLADPYIAEAFDFNGAAAEGSSLTSAGIIGQAVQAVIQERSINEGTAFNHVPKARTAWGDEAENKPAPLVGNDCEHPHDGDPSQFWAPNMSGGAEHLCTAGQIQRLGTANREPADRGSARMAPGPPRPRDPPMLQPPPAPLTTQELNDLRLQRWGRKREATPPHVAILRQPSETGAFSPRISFHHPSAHAYASDATASGTLVGAMTNVLYEAAKSAEQAEAEHKFVQQLEQARALAQVGVLTTLPLWAGGPHPVSNPHLGPGQPHHQLLRLLAVYRSQPLAEPMLKLAPAAAAQLNPHVMPAKQRRRKISSPTLTSHNPQAPDAASAQYAAAPVAIVTPPSWLPQTSSPAYTQGNPAIQPPYLHTAPPGADPPAAFSPPHKQWAPGARQTPSGLQGSYPGSHEHTGATQPATAPESSCDAKASKLPWPFGPWQPTSKPVKQEVIETPLAWPLGQAPPWQQSYPFYSPPGQGPFTPSSLASPGWYGVHQGPWTLPPGYVPKIAVNAYTGPDGPSSSWLANGNAMRVGAHDSGMYAVYPTVLASQASQQAPPLTPAAQPHADSTHAQPMQLPVQQWNGQPSVGQVGIWPTVVAGSNWASQGNAGQGGLAWPMPQPDTIGSDSGYGMAAQPWAPAPAPVLYPYHYQPFPQQDPGKSVASDKQQATAQAPQPHFPHHLGSHVWATAEAAAAMYPMPGHSHHGTPHQQGEDPARQAAPAGQLSQQTTAEAGVESDVIGRPPSVPKLNFNALQSPQKASALYDSMGSGSVAQSEPVVGSSADPAITTSVSYEQWAKSQGVARSDTLVQYEPQWPSQGELSPAQTPRDATESSNTASLTTVEQLVKPSERSLPFTAQALTGPASPGGTLSQPLSPRSSLAVTVSESDLPPPAFDRPRTPRLGHSRLGNASHDGLDSSGVGSATAIPGEAPSRTQQLAHSAKQMIKNFKGLLRGVTKPKVVAAQKPLVTSQDAMPIGILPTSLEVVTEEQEEFDEDDSTPATAEGGTALAEPETPPPTSHVASQDPTRTASPARRALEAAFGSVKAVWNRGGKTASASLSPEASQLPPAGYYPQIPKGHVTSSWPYGDATQRTYSDDAGYGGLTQHADLLMASASSQESISAAQLGEGSEANSLMQTFRRRGGTGSLRASTDGASIGTGPFTQKPQLSDLRYEKRSVPRGRI